MAYLVMKPKPSPWAELYRVTQGPMASTARLGNNGQFRLPLPSGFLLVQISDEAGWDHASVTVRDCDGEALARCPTWEEMCYVKSVFFRDDEWVLQFHPPRDQNISCHDTCLHLWRCRNGRQSIPPSWMVAPKEYKA